MTRKNNRPDPVNHTPGGEVPLPKGGEIVLYQALDGSISLDVRLQRETIWLNQKQMALLFEKDSDTIGLHIRNAFRERELEEQSTTEDFSVVQTEGGRDVRRRVRFYNLDVIISVGYRVKSLRGTQFRIWATRVLHDHILKGYTVNQRRLEELNQTVRSIAGMVDRRDLSGDEAKGLLQVVGEYSFALDLLDDYDHQRVSTVDQGTQTRYTLTYEDSLRVIECLKEKFGDSDLFGREKDAGLQSALGAVVQTFDGKDVYPGLEEKAAHLLYFLVKNHAFVDGNKRIAATLFLWFLSKNDALYSRDGYPRIADAALVAITLLIAESRPAEMKIIVRIITHLLDERRREVAS